MKERERYEPEISAEQAEVPTLTVVPYTASIDCSLLKNLPFMGKFDKIAPGVTSESGLTDEHIKTYVTSLVVRSSDSEVDLSIIDKALEGFTMPNHIARRRTYHPILLELFERLEGVGYDTFRENNPKKTVSLLTQHLIPAPLKRGMRRRISYDERLESNIQKFIIV